MSETNTANDGIINDSEGGPIPDSMQFIPESSIVPESSFVPESSQQIPDSSASETALPGGLPTGTKEKKISKNTIKKNLPFIVIGVIGLVLVGSFVVRTVTQPVAPTQAEAQSLTKPVQEIQGSNPDRTLTPSDKSPSGLASPVSGDGQSDIKGGLLSAEASMQNAGGKTDQPNAGREAVQKQALTSVAAGGDINGKSSEQKISAETSTVVAPESSPVPAKSSSQQVAPVPAQKPAAVPVIAPAPSAAPTKPAPQQVAPVEAPEPVVVPDNSLSGAKPRVDRKRSEGVKGSSSTEAKKAESEVNGTSSLKGGVEKNIEAQITQHHEDEVRAQGSYPQARKKTKVARKPSRTSNATKNKVDPSEVIFEGQGEEVLIEEVEKTPSQIKKQKITASPRINKGKGNLKISSHAKKEKKRKPLEVSVSGPAVQITGWRLHAVRYGVAWLVDDNGKTVSVSVGDSVQGAGVVTRIDEENMKIYFGKLFLEQM